MNLVNMTRKKTADDFKFIKLIGEGSFSLVYLAVDAQTTGAQIKEHFNSQNESGIETESDSSDINSPNRKVALSTGVVRRYAIKVCQKSHLQRQGKQYTKAIMREKEIMNIFNVHPNKHFIKLFYTFHDVKRLYFVMNYAENGDLLTLIQSQDRLPLHSVRKYTLQLITALEHMHYLGIIHRDLKPENILLNSEMNILLTDFGSAKICNETQAQNSVSNSERRNSFVGTAQYVSPEMLKSRMATNKSDLWALGVIIFQLVTSMMPFSAPNEYLIYQKIQNLDYSYPSYFDQEARDLASSLIKLEPEERIGAMDDVMNGGYLSLRAHVFLNKPDGQIGTPSVPDCLKARKPLDLDPDILDSIRPGLDEAQMLKLLTSG